MTRPRIGITTSLNAADRGGREQRLDLAYVRAVERAGGGSRSSCRCWRPPAPPTPSRPCSDGLVVTGGPAVTQGLVGDLPDDIDETDADRTASDTQILRAFLDARRPTLGICYGMQLANALRGGTIYADVERQARRGPQPGARRDGPRRDGGRRDAVRGGGRGRGDLGQHAPRTGDRESGRGSGGRGAVHRTG